jgi:hypothetical protein
MISERALEAAFPGKGGTLRSILTGSMSYVDAYDSVQNWVKKCHNMPSVTERRLEAANEVLEGHGVEAIWGKSETRPVAVYVNMGDTYATALLYNYQTGAWSITSWGDFAERNERRYHLR